MPPPFGRIRCSCRFAKLGVCGPSCAWSFAALRSARLYPVMRHSQTPRFMTKPPVAAKLQGNVRSTLPAIHGGFSGGSFAAGRVCVAPRGGLCTVRVHERGALFQEPRNSTALRPRAERRGTSARKNPPSLAGFSLGVCRRQTPPVRYTRTAWLQRHPWRRRFAAQDAGAGRLMRGVSRLFGVRGYIPSCAIAKPRASRPKRAKPGQSAARITPPTDRVEFRGSSDPTAIPRPAQ